MEAIDLYYQHRVDPDVPIEETAWVLGRGQDMIPIPGTKRRRYLEESAQAVNIRLNAENISALERAFTPHAVSGERYPAAQMKRVGI